MNSRRARAVGYALVAMMLAGSQPAWAQQARPRGTPRVEVSAGAGVVTGVDVGALDANLRANGQTPASYRLFTTSSEVGATPAIDARVAVWLTRLIGVEGQAVIGRPMLTVSIASDVEGIPDTNATDRIDQVMASAALVVRAHDPRRPRRLVPFATVGAGVLREAFGAGTTVEQHPLVKVGGGLRQIRALRPRGGLQTIGWRAGVDAMFVSGSSGLRQGRTSQVMASAGVFFGF